MYLRDTHIIHRIPDNSLDGPADELFSPVRGGQRYTRCRYVRHVDPEIAVRGIRTLVRGGVAACYLDAATL